MNRILYSNLLEGTRLFARFEVIRCLSASDLGGVYLCRDAQRGGQHTALKVIGTPKPVNRAAGTQFRREMMIGRGIDHPHVVRSDQFFRDDTFTAFSMQYFGGGTLANELAREGPQPVSRVIEILAQICEGVSAIHAVGIVHRDLKPENILIADNGTIKIADFGIASYGIADGPSTEEKIVGTLNYLSPEYLESGAFDRRSDIYAIGVIAYEMIVGRMPFQGTSFMESLSMRVKFDPKAPHLLQPSCPNALSNLILTAMSRSAEKRFQRVEDVIKGLAAVGYSSGSFPRLSIDVEGSAHEPWSQLVPR